MTSIAIILIISLWIFIIIFGKPSSSDPSNTNNDSFDHTEKKEDIMLDFDFNHIPGNMYHDEPFNNFSDF